MRKATAQEREFLRKHYNEFTAKELGAMLGWSAKKVYNEAYEYGIAKRQVEVTEELKNKVLTELDGVPAVLAGEIIGVGHSTIRKIREGTHTQRKRWFE